MTDKNQAQAGERRTVASVFFPVLRLGLTSFGGPVAHLGYFHDEFVVRRKWLDERSFADLVALCQFLPGPASSQVGIGVGLARAGLPGAVAAWIAFTMPTAIAPIGTPAILPTTVSIAVFDGKPFSVTFLIDGVGIPCIDQMAQFMNQDIVQLVVPSR